MKLTCLFGALGLALASLSVQANDRESGRQLFTSGTAPSCAVCHSLKDAQAEGAIGPSLDELKPDAERVATAVKNGLGIMPAFRDKLSEQQINLLSRYVAEASRAPR